MNDGRYDVANARRTELKNRKDFRLRLLKEVAECETIEDVKGLLVQVINFLVR
jgi:hypothetical protein